MIAFQYSNGGATTDIFHFTNPGELDSISGNSTQATLSGTAGLVQLLVSGTNLSFLGLTPTGGTVDTIVYSVDGNTTVVVTGLSLDFAAIVQPSFGGALSNEAAYHFDVTGDTTAQNIAAGMGEDTISSSGGSDSLYGGFGDDELTLSERGSGMNSPAVVNGGDGYDEVWVTDLSGSPYEGINLSNATFSEVEFLGLGANTATALSSTQAAGLMIDFGANATLILQQVAAQALNLSTLFTVAGPIAAGAGIFLVGTTGNDVQRGLTGIRHLMSGDGGDDSLTGGSLQDTITGGSGNDTLFGGGAADSLAGGTGNDLYSLTAGDIVTEQQGEGTDRVLVGFSHALGANVENGTLLGSATINLTGNGLNNDLRGNGAANTIAGGVANDTLDGGGGADSLDGGAGNDRVFGGLGHDRIVGAGGSDNLAGEDGNDSIYGGLGEESLTGGAGDDLILGGDGYDGFYGGAGNDRLFGEAQNDMISGDGGNDVLHGGTGNDLLIGGAGRDTFVFATGFGRDTVHDFVFSGTSSDKLDIQNLTAVTSFLDLKTNHLVQSGADVLIKAGTDVLVLKGLTVSQLDAADFLI